ncbi:MAG: hypothetical protein F9K31_00365 [Dokdonella sp.]|nr:MAG: hypothetical protein F9K31_00365 [Dokdonella sp.]
MSHGDHVTQAPPGFTVTACTDHIPVAAMSDEARRWYGVQFHPEVTHTKQGRVLLQRFVVDVCGCAPLWTPAQIIEDWIARVRAQVGTDEVILGLSGGVGSSVVAALAVWSYLGLMRIDPRWTLTAPRGGLLFLGLMLVAANAAVWFAGSGHANVRRRIEIGIAGWIWFLVQAFGGWYLLLHWGAD